MASRYSFGTYGFISCDGTGMRRLDGTGQTVFATTILSIWFGHAKGAWKRPFGAPVWCGLVQRNSRASKRSC